MPEVQTRRRPGAAALMGVLCLLPFFSLNAIVANRIEPFFSFIRPGPRTSGLEIVLLTVALGCIPLGAFIAARPLFDRTAPRPLRAYLLNGALGAVMLVVFVILVAGIGAEIYRCDVLGIPNCD